MTWSHSSFASGARAADAAPPPVGHDVTCLSCDRISDEQRSFRDTQKEDCVPSKRSFDPKAFLASVGNGRTLGKFRKGDSVFSQGEPADAVFYTQKGKVKITVVSQQGKEAVVAILGSGEFFGEVALPVRASAYRQ